MKAVGREVPLFRPEGAGQGAEPSLGRGVAGRARARGCGGGGQGHEGSATEFTGAALRGLRPRGGRARGRSGGLTGLIEVNASFAAPDY